MTAVLAQVDPFVQWFAERLLTGSVQGGLVIGLVWITCRMRRTMSAGLRAALWWLACVKLVLVLTPLPGIPLPVLPNRQPSPVAPFDVVTFPELRPFSAAVDGTPVHADTGNGDRTPTASVAPATARTPGPASPWQPRWLSVLIGLWAAGVIVQMVMLAIARRRLAVVAARSRPADERAAGHAVRLARVLGLRRVPDVCVSGDVQAPQVVGFWHPRILIPAEAAATFTDDEWEMTLGHELMHVRRHDLAIGWIPAIAERVFFFHPLAHLAVREYLLAREAACDAAVLRALDLAPHRYGRLLVRLGVSSPAAGLSAGGSSPSSSLLRRRLQMLHNVAIQTSADRDGRSARTRQRLLVAIVAAIAVTPFYLAARSAQPLARGGSDVALPAQPQGVEAAVRRGAEIVARRAAERQAAQTGQAPLAPQAPRAPLVPQAQRQVEQIPPVRELPLSMSAQEFVDAQEAYLRMKIESAKAQQEELSAQLREMERALTKMADQMRLVQPSGDADVQQRAADAVDLENARRLLEARKEELERKFTAQHPARLQLEKLTEQLAAQEAALTKARTNLEQQERTFQDAQRKLAEAELRLRREMQRAIQEVIEQK